MKTNISKIICAILSLVVVLSLSACGASGGFSAKADSTWGELCRSFDSEWYDSLAEGVRAQFDALALTAEQGEESTEKSIFTEIDADSFSAYGEDSEKMSTRYGLICTNAMALMLNEQSGAVDYTASVTSTIEDLSAEMTVIVALVDEKGGYTAIDKANLTISEGSVESLNGSFGELKSGAKYTVKAIAIANAEGFRNVTPLFVEKEVTVK